MQSGFMLRLPSLQAMCSEQVFPHVLFVLVITKNAHAQCAARAAICYDHTCL
jgi:hypothetical protein